MRKPRSPPASPPFCSVWPYHGFFLETFEKSVWWEMIGAAEAAFAPRGFAPFCFIHPFIYFKQSRARNTPTISSSPQTPTVSRPQEMFPLLPQLPHPFATGYLCSFTRNSALSPLPVGPGLQQPSPSDPARSWCHSRHRAGFGSPSPPPLLGKAGEKAGSPAL